MHKEKHEATKNFGIVVCHGMLKWVVKDSEIFIKIDYFFFLGFSWNAVILIIRKYYGFIKNKASL